MKIGILSGSVRKGRNSHRVVQYFKNFIDEHKLAEVEMIDLLNYNFPVFDERLKYQSSPTEAMLDFAQKIKSVDGIILVTPEYNGGYPASLKNAIDLLYEEWKRKPIALVTVSAGPFGGAQVTPSLLFSLWKIGSWVVPAMFPVPNVESTYDENGIAHDQEKTDKRAKVFLDELIWCIEAKTRMQQTIVHLT
jgi:NAD(P)H-dependent FMN reductase